MREKRGISDIVSTVLIIIIVLVSVVVVWGVVSKLIKDKISDLGDTELLKVNFQIKDVVINYSVIIDFKLNNVTDFSVTRGADKANLFMARIVFTGKKGEIVFNETAPGVLGTQSYTIIFNGIGNLTKIEVYPVSQKGKLGIPAVYNVKGTEPNNRRGGGWTNPPTLPGAGGPGGGGVCTEPDPCDTYDCGYWMKCGTSEDCGICSSDQTCQGGFCFVIPTITYYKDADGDGYGTGETTTTPTSGYFTIASGHFAGGSTIGDCDDNPATGAGINPGITEINDNWIDENCDTWDNITICKTLNFKYGNYSLNNNILNVPGTCFTIAASGIALNGNGYKINGGSGNTGYGVYVQGIMEAEFIQYRKIQNLNITKFKTGIYLENTGYGIEIRNNFVEVSTGYGVTILNNITAFYNNKLCGNTYDDFQCLPPGNTTGSDNSNRIRTVSLKCDNINPANPLWPTTWPTTIGNCNVL